jgi:transcriptional regulator with XRE-family HTH domain
MAEARLDPERVRQARQEAGLSQRALGKHLGVSVISVRDLERRRGQSGYSTPFLGRLAAVLGRDLRSLLLAPKKPTAMTTRAMATTMPQPSLVMTRRSWHQPY